MTRAGSACSTPEKLPVSRGHVAEFKCRVPFNYANPVQTISEWITGILDIDDAHPPLASQIAAANTDVTVLHLSSCPCHDRLYRDVASDESTMSAAGRMLNAEVQKVKRIGIIRSATWGLVLGCLCMSAFLFYIDRPRSVPLFGYVIDILGAGVAAAAVFSLGAWLNNWAAGSAD